MKTNYATTINQFESLCEITLQIQGDAAADTIGNMFDFIRGGWSDWGLKCEVAFAIDNYLKH